METTPQPLGPRAYFLLGLLVCQTRTVSELCALLEEGVNDPEILGILDDLPPGLGSPGLTIRSLADVGEVEVRRLLGRLEEVGLARRVELDDSEIWTASRFG